MEYCKIPVVLSYLAACYILASTYYMLMTRNIGTPFKDAVSKYPELVAIKTESANQRRKIFYTGIVVSIVLMVVVRPFSRCN